MRGCRWLLFSGFGIWRGGAGQGLIAGESRSEGACELRAKDGKKVGLNSWRLERGLGFLIRLLACEWKEAPTYTVFTSFS